MKRLIPFALLMVIAAAWAPSKNGYEPGDIASDFSLKNVDGKMVSLKDWKDAKGFVLIFDCNTCPYSKAYNKRIVALDAAYSSKGYQVVAINSNDPQISPGDSYEDMVAYARKHGYKFPYLFDETQKVGHMYGATNTPHVFVLQKSGSELKVAYIGTIDDSPRDESSVGKRYVEDAINALMAGKQVPLSRTKAIGCGIKYRS